MNIGYFRRDLALFPDPGRDCVLHKPVFDILLGHILTFPYN